MVETPDAVVRAYYDAIDAGEYDALGSVLAPEFVQRRPDRTFEGREAFVRFMREDRPRTDTAHELEAVIADGDRVAVQGRLLASSGDALFAFVDVFTVEDGEIVRLDTYTR